MYIRRGVLCLLQMRETAVMRAMTGAAALHVLLMRVMFAQDAYAVFGWKADTLYTIADVRSRFDELAKALNGDKWHARTKAVRKALFPVVMGALGRVGWAMNIIYARLEVMNDLSDGETDVEA